MGKLRDVGNSVQERYENGERRPLPGYVMGLGAYGGLVGVLAAVGRAVGARLPERIGLGDTVLISLATHKASRILAKDAITSPLRAPFTRYQEPAGDAELNESVRGHGARHAFGELITCPFCLGVWFATTFSAGMVVAPRATRLAATVLSAVAASDALQLVYDQGKQRVNGPEPE